MKKIQNLNYVGDGSEDYVDITWRCCGNYWHRVLKSGYLYPTDMEKWNPVCPICGETWNPSPDLSELDPKEVRELNEIFGS